MTLDKTLLDLHDIVKAATEGLQEAQESQYGEYTTEILLSLRSAVEELGDTLEEML